MKRQFKWDKKYIHWGMTAFCVIAGAILFFMALNYLPAIGGALKSLMTIMSPFVWGLGITYILLPLMRSLEGNVFQPLFRRISKGKRDIEKSARGFAVLVSEIVLILCITAFFYLIIPQLYSSIETIVLNSNSYVNNLTNWVTRIFADYPEVGAYVMNILQSAEKDIETWATQTLLPGIGSLITNLTVGVAYVLKAVYYIIIGMIVSVYILSNIERFKGGVKRLAYCLFSVETTEKLRDGLEFTNRTFMGFIKGKLLDSAIIGLISYIFCVIVDMPYALLVSVIIGVTNIIPFFGPFIGAIPSALLILFVSPLKCLIFVIFIIVLQQLDGNLIGPKILGSTVGINGFWVMFSIIVGAGFFGFWGMLLGVPVFVVIYTLLDRSIERKLKRSALPTDTASYVDIEHIDPATLQIKRRGDDTPSPVGQSVPRLKK